MSPRLSVVVCLVGLVPSVAFGQCQAGRTGGGGGPGRGVPGIKGPGRGPSPPVPMTRTPSLQTPVTAQRLPPMNQPLAPQQQLQLQLLLQRQLQQQQQLNQAIAVQRQQFVQAQQVQMARQKQANLQQAVPKANTHLAPADELRRYFDTISAPSGIQGVSIITDPARRQQLGLPPLTPQQAADAGVPAPPAGGK